MKCKACWAVIPDESEICPKCGTSLMEPPPPEDYDPGKGWFVVVNDEQKGPLPAEQIEEMIAAGKIKEKNLVRQEGDTDWSPASRFFRIEATPKSLPTESLEKKIDSNRCPKCGSWNIQRLSMYLSERKARKRGGGGCLGGCLMIFILFLIAPGYCLCTTIGAGAGAGVLIAEYWWLILLIILTMIGVSVGQYFYFICKSCGHKFLKR